MARPLLLTSLLLSAVSFVTAQEQVTREIPLWHQSAIEIAALFASGGPPAPPPAPEPLEQVALRYAIQAVADVSRTAWHWQSFVEVSPAPPPSAAGAGLGKMLPTGLAGPPTALLWRNSLKVTGTEEAIGKLREIMGLLDKPTVRLGLEVSVLSLEPARAAKLPGVDWSCRADDREDERLRLYFAHGDSTKLLADPATNSAPLTASVTVGNNASTAMTFVEAMPYYARRAENGPPDLLTRVRVLRLTLTPRRNADDSLTLLGQTAFYAGRAVGDRPDKMAEEGRWLADRETQVRVAAGESMLLRGVGNDVLTFSAEGVEFGPQRLLDPLVVVTPRPLPAEEAYLRDAGPLEGDVRDRMLNTIFGKALREGADGVMAGLDEEGYTTVWYQRGPNQWERVMRMPLFMLGPLTHILADPADANGEYRRQDPTGAVLDLTVTRQQVGGQPGVVLTWPKQ
ncbi:hypothetical protein LLH23_10985 [bacterium]|nr:hypothetical protein [bacterium]